MEKLSHEKQIQEYEKTIALLKEGSLFSFDELQKLEAKLADLKKKAYSELTAWERVLICRHPGRPHSIDYITHICTDFIELCGDRNFADDRAIMGGFAKIGDCKCMVIGQEKGSDTQERLKRNFGMPHPEGFRKALRLMRLAEKLSLPIILFIDTSGAMPTLAAEERGQAWAIAENLRAMSRLATPLIVVIVGEAGSGGALALAIGDSIAMLEHSYYSVISPEGCASILWKDASKKERAAEALKLTSEHIKELGIVDDIIEEPSGGAHLDPAFVYAKVKEYILSQRDHLQLLPTEALVERRYQKFRKMGRTCVS